MKEKKKNSLYKYLQKDIKDFNKYILSFVCIGILVGAGLLSYYITSSYALFSDTIMGTKTIEGTVDVRSTVSLKFVNGSIAKDESTSKTINKGGSTTFKISPTLGYGNPTVSCTTEVTSSATDELLTLKNVKDDTECTVTYNILTWSNSSDKQLKTVLTAATEGKLDLSSWKVGEERKITINAFSGKFTSSIPAQTATLVIMNIGGKTRTDGKTCNFVVGFKEAIINQEYYNSSNASNDYKNSDLDNTMTKIYNALPADTQALFQDWNVLVGNPNTKGVDSGILTGTQTLSRKLAAPAYKEVLGESKSYHTDEDNALTQLEYFKTSANRIKYYKGTATIWRLRSPAYWDTVGDCDSYCIKTTGVKGVYAVSDGRSVSPIGCV